MNLQQYLALFRQRWRIVAAGLVVGLLAAGLFSLLSPPSYTARMTLYVYAQTGATPDATYEGTLTSEKRVSSYTALLTDERVTTDVVDRLRLSETPQELAKQISASNASDSVLIDLAVTERSPQAAADVANAVATSFVGVVNDLERPTAPNLAQPVAVRAVKPASPPLEASSPGLAVSLAAGGALGLALGLVAALILNASDTTIRELRTLRELTGVPNLGTFAQNADFRDRPLIQNDPQPSLRAEDFKQLRTNLQFLDVDRPRRVVLFTSSQQGEGKSTTVANLAIALASAGSRVVVVDADLRRPKLAELFEVEGQAGLTSVLTNRATLDQVLQRPGKVDILAAGAIPPNPSEMLGSQHMRHVLHELASRYDVVLVDSPPLLPVTDAAVLAPAADAVILACRYQKTTRNDVQMAGEVLTAVSAPLAGTVVTMVPRTVREVYGSAQPYVAVGAPPRGGRDTARSTASGGTPARAAGEPAPVTDPARHSRGEPPARRSVTTHSARSADRDDPYPSSPTTAATPRNGRTSHYSNGSLRPRPAPDTRSW